MSSAEDPRGRVHFQLLDANEMGMELSDDALDTMIVRQFEDPKAESDVWVMTTEDARKLYERLDARFGGKTDE